MLQVVIFLWVRIVNLRCRVFERFVCRKDFLVFLF